MNQIERKMLESIKTLTPMESGNTKVDVFGKTIKVYLQNKLIADIDYSYPIEPFECDGRLIVLTENMNPLLKSRLNVILDAFHKPSICIYRGRFCFDNSWFTGSTHTFYGLDN